MEWHPYRSAREGRAPTVTVLEGEEFACAFCKGTGRAGMVRGTGGQCPVCRGQKSVKVTPPAVRCAYCKGRGESSPRSNITCSVCRGKGVVSVREPGETCRTCRGRGATGGGKLPCTTCHGKGVVTAPSPGRTPAPGPRGILIKRSQRRSREGCEAFAPPDTKTG